ncbi:MAG: hypothetical protein ACTHL1_12535 [Burkholderiaceae bacterium]
MKPTMRTLPKSSVPADSWAEQCRLYGGRLAVIASIATFVSCYAYGLYHYGIFLGILLGWLPCGAAAWLTAVLVAKGFRQLPPRVLGKVFRTTNRMSAALSREHRRRPSFR